jgi:hypothetical protein
MNNNIQVNGVVTIQIYDENQNISETIINKNLVVASGLRFFIDKIIDATSHEIKKIGIGDGTTPSDLGDTGLQSSTNFIDDVMNVASDTSNSFVADIIISDNYGGSTVSEVALFASDGSTDILIARTVLNENQRFVKEDGKNISIYWKITLG